MPMKTIFCDLQRMVIHFPQKTSISLLLTTTKKTSFGRDNLKLKKTKQLPNFKKTEKTNGYVHLKAEM